VQGGSVFRFIFLLPFRSVEDLFQVRVAVKMSVDLIRPVRVFKSCLVASKRLTRPEKSLHFLVKSPDTNLHFLVSPEIALHLITG